MLHSTFLPIRPHTYTYISFCRLLKPTTFFSRHLSSQRRKTRMIILSDTHGNDLKDITLPRADVAIHCGDLTNDSRSVELERTLKMLRAIDAPLKLIIPGNHDFGLEQGYWRRTWAYTRPAQHPQQRLDSSLSAQTAEAEEDADHKTSWELLRCAAQRDGIFLLPQGTHSFVLNPYLARVGGDEARLRLFASPLTPRKGNWGFQYDRSNPHRWAIPPATSNGDGDGDGDDAVDVVITHGPPMGIRDGTGTRQGSAGCAGLLAAVERARPRLHCFGHIHGAWGAEVVTWKREIVDSCAAAFSGPSAPVYNNLVNAQQSRVIAGLSPANKSASTEAGAGEYSLTPLSILTTTTQRHHYLPRKEGHCYAVDISSDGEHTVERGTQTLFVNAAVDICSKDPRLPWLVDIDLPVAGKKDAAAAAETMYRLLL